MAESRNGRAQRSTTRFIEISTSRSYYTCRCYRIGLPGGFPSPSLPPQVCARAPGQIFSGRERVRESEREREGDRERERERERDIAKSKDSRYSGGRVENRDKKKERELILDCNG